MRPAVGEEIGPEDDAGPDGVRRVFAEGLAEWSEEEAAGRELGGDAEDGECAEEAVERCCIGVAGLGQFLGGALVVAEGVGYAEPGGGAGCSCASRTLPCPPVRCLR